MRKIISLILLILLTIGVPLALLFVLLTHPTQGSQSLSECPAGSYNIGEIKNGKRICKLEPTGCPYGDSIPMDMCDKFKPVEPVQDAPVKVLSKTVIQGEGK